MRVGKFIYRFFLVLFLVFNSFDLNAENITVGTISINPMEVIEVMSPLAKYLAAHLKEENISGGKVVIARDTGTMARYMNEGKVDIFIESVFPALIVNIATGNKIVLSRWKGGVGQYSSVIIAKKDLSSLEQLRGEKITFDHPYSTSGYFIPKTMLLNKGFTVIPFQHDIQPKDSSAISYIFSNADENTYFRVLRGVVKAGAMDEPSYLKLSGEYRESLNILYKSPPIPRQVVIFNKKLSADISKKLVSLLTKMDSSIEGSTVLRNYQNTTKFDFLSKEDFQLIESYKKTIKTHYKEYLK